MRKFQSARFLNVWPKLLPRFVQSTRIRVSSNEKVGDGRPALGGALRHQAGDGAAAVNYGGRRHGFGFRGSKNVGSKNFSPGARAAGIGEIDAAFAGETSRFGRDLDG